MKKVILLTLGIFLLLGSASYVVAKRYIANKLSGEMVTQSHFRGDAINAVSVGFAWDVILTQGDNNGVSLSFPKEYQKYLVCKMDGDKLVLGFDNLPQALCSNIGEIKFTAEVSVAGLRELKLSGSSDVIIDGTINANCPETRIVTGGSSNVKGLGSLICGSLDLTCSGSSDFKLNAIKCNGNTRIVCSGSSDFKTSSLTVGGRAEILMGGSSDFASALSCTGDATLMASGSSDFKVSGHAANTKVVCSGSSDFHGANFKVNNANISAGGSSKISINIAGTADVSASGASDVNVYGNPRSQNFHTSGSSDIRKK